MSKDYTGYKSLTGIGPVNASVSASVGAAVTATISSGSIVFNNVQIIGGTIDGVTVGSGESGPVTATTITSGYPGTGYSVCFYSPVINDSACWIPTTGTWNIQGNLLVRDTSNLGNLNITANSITSTNNNGNINLLTNGTGRLLINSGITQGTSTGDLSFQTSNGFFQLSSGLTNTLTSGTDTSLITKNGDITLETGTVNPSLPISFISSGVSSVTVTTTSANGLKIGDIVTLSSTNSTPNVNGDFTVSSILSTTSFTIPITVPVISSGTSGNLQKHNNIFLSASDSIFIPSNVDLTFGGISTISNNGVDTTIDTGTGTLTILGDLIVEGGATYLNSTVVTVQEPVFNLGGLDPVLVTDTMDRGISANYNNSTSKTLFFGRNASSGCFTYIPDATEISPGVFTGTPGCATFGTLTASNVNISSGSVTSLTISNLTTCNIICNGTMSITAATGINFTTPSASFSGTLSSTGNITTSANVNGVSGVFSNNVASATTNTSGLTTTGTLNSGNTSITGNLGVTGTTTSNVVNSVTSNTSGTHTSGTSITTGNSTVNGSSTTDSLIVTNNTTTGSLNVNANATITGTTTSGTFSGTTSTISGTSTSGTFSGTTSTISGTSTTGTSVVTNNQSVGGTSTVNTSVITNNQSVGGTLSVTGTSTLGVTNVTDLGVSGNAAINNLTISGNFAMSLEHLSASSGVLSPTISKVITFVNITGAATITGVLGNGTYDGQLKWIFLSTCVTNGIYQVSAINNLVDPGSGSSATKLLTFRSPGQSIQLIWDHVASFWLITGGAGCCIS